MDSDARRLKLFGMALLGAALVALAAAALAGAAGRTFETTLTPPAQGFESANSVAFDAAGNAWVTDETAGEPLYSRGVYKYAPYPSKSVLIEPDASALYGSRGFQVAVDQETGETYAADYNGRNTIIYEPDGTVSRLWTHIDNIGQNYEGFSIAIDNSTDPRSRGRVYVSLTAPENVVKVFDGEQRPVDFPATAAYIEGNTLTGTPNGRFGSVGAIATGPNGELFVADQENAVISEFDSTGTFVREFPGRGPMTVDPTNGNILSVRGADLFEYDSSGNRLNIIEEGGGGYFQVNGFAGVNPDGYLYVPVIGSEGVDIFSPAPVVPAASYQAVSDPTTTSGTLNATVDPNGAGPITECRFEYGTDTSYESGELPCQPGAPISAVTPVEAELSGLTADTTYHYRVVAEDANGVKYGADRTYTPHAVLGLTTDPATGIGAGAATLNASYVGNGADTHYYFEWGPTDSYGNTSSAPPGVDAHSPAGPARTALPAEITGLEPYATYHYRVVAENGSGPVYGEDRYFTTEPAAPSVVSQSSTEIHSDRAVLHAQINPHGADTSYRFEIVSDADFQKSEWADATVTGVPNDGTGRGRSPQSVSTLVGGLQPGTLYHYRAVADNEAGSGSPGAQYTFTTFPFTKEINDPCPNSHVRQQTGSGLLSDCRGYELVSSANAGGYDVESSLVPGQTPFAGYPQAEGPPQVLYGIHDGALSSGHPTNRGVDPYVATRSETGWNTEYVGIPANNPYATSQFSSTVEEASAGLDTFAFGGPGICAPCFPDGSSGEPVHLPDGELVQGMTGSISQPAAQPAGFVGKRLSEDGTHLVFGSTTKLEPDANSNGDVSIYDRDLSAGQTHVVSKTPGGATMTGAGIGELDISADGSHIVVGQLVSEAGGAKHWHLYMNLGDASSSIDLTPGTTSGVLYDGMTADGSKVFFTTEDQLDNADQDESADLYEATISGGAAELHLISTGSAGTGNSDACSPAADTEHVRWNSTGSAPNCGIVAVGGGGGVARADGTVYFLSPERLDGPSNGVQNAPNLYVSRPGAAPKFVATLESSANSPLPPPTHPYLRSVGGLINPTGIAADDSNGDTYVLDVKHEDGILNSEVSKFDAAGNLVDNFASHGKLRSFNFHELEELGSRDLPAEIAVDNDPSSPSYRDLYIPNLGSQTVIKFSPLGTELEEIEIAGAAGVTVDRSNGHLYVVRYGGEVVVFDALGHELSSFETEPRSTSVALGAGGQIYVADGTSTEVYNSAGEPLSTLSTNPSVGLAVDPADNHVFVDEGDRVSEFDPSGNQVNLPFGSERLSQSVGLAVYGEEILVSNEADGELAIFGGPKVIDPAAENPLVIDSVSSPDTRHSGDFEINPDGEDAVFTSVLPLTGYDNSDHREVFRYDAPESRTDCVSCNPTSEQADQDASLPANGLGLSDDGRVFFNTTEGLVDRDNNENEDAYQWEAQGMGPEAVACQQSTGCVNLISTGTSPYGSKLLGVSADAVDSYFFTRDKLVEQDGNGDSVKIYDARSFGGFPFAPPPVQCKASDECHGPSSQVPPPPDIKTVAPTKVAEGTGAVKCRTHFVKRHGRCVRKAHHRSSSHGRSHHGGRK